MTVYNMEIIAPEKTGIKLQSVSEITTKIKNLIESNFSHAYIFGEISNFKVATSGHAYFVLKDAEATIDAVMFREASRKLPMKPADGMQVNALGRISLYKPRGSYQIVIDTMEPRGLGSLFIEFNKLKEKLAKEGLFDEIYKKPIPFIPRKIGIITSPTGAAVRDMLRVIYSRFSPEVVIFPVKVQGDEAKAEIKNAIECANQRNDIDVIILGRGGGSLEDLWAFNEEIVARAIFASEIPIISAVGHEIDFTIADFVADLRAPTPSVAAELVVPKKEDLRLMLQTLHIRLSNKIIAMVKQKRQILFHIKKRLISPKKRLEDMRLKIDDTTNKLNFLMKRMLENKTMTLKVHRENLRNLNPLAILDRGYSIVHDASGKIIKSSEHVQTGDSISVTLYTGALNCEVRSKN